MENKTQTLSELLDGLRKELKAAKQSRLVTLIAGALLVVLVFVVMAVTASTVKKNVRPDTLADVAAFATRQMVKEGRPAVEKALKAKLPEFLRALRIALVNDVIPAMRKQVENELRGMVAKTMASSSQAFVAAVRTTAAKLKPEVEKGAKPDNAMLASLIVREFENEKGRRFTQEADDTLGASFAESKRMLVGLKRKVDLFVSGKPASRQEAMEMRFIRAWVSLVDKGQDGKGPMAAPPTAP